jgi:hypothetical protein
MTLSSEQCRVQIRQTNALDSQRYRIIFVKRALNWALFLSKRLDFTGEESD